MAKVKTLIGSSLLIQIGDGGGPENFAHDCFINTSRGIQIESDQNEFAIPDCDDPTLPAWRELFKDNLRATVSGAGTLHTASIETWWNWMIIDTSKNVRVKFDVAGALGGGYIAGAFKLTSLNIQAASRKEYANADVTLMSDGVLTWTDNA